MNGELDKIEKFLIDAFWNGYGAYNTPLDFRYRFDYTIII